MSTWSIINSKTDYLKAMDRAEELSAHPPELHSKEGQELMLLGYLIQDFEDKNFDISYPEPIGAIQARMEQLGLKVNDLTDVFGDRGTASKVLSGQKNLSINMIRALSTKLSLPVELLIQPARVYSSHSKKETVLVQESQGQYKKTSRKK
jgi:HTH-type transcriptional regulator / antitoxin HigA